MGCCLAEGEGFEPPKPFRACRVSSAVPSTTRPSFQASYLLFIFFIVIDVAVLNGIELINVHAPVPLCTTDAATPEL